MHTLARSARTLPAAALAAVLTTLAACGGGDGATGPGSGGANATGQFSGNVSGHVSRSLAGPAYYAQVDQDGEVGFAVGMGALAADKQTFADMVVIGRERTGVPAAGTYPLHDVASDADPQAEAFVLVSTLTMPNGDDLTCFGTSGTVTFQAASGGRLKGSYTTQASCLDPAAPETMRAVALSGAFEAVESSRVPSAHRAAR